MPLDADALENGLVDLFKNPPKGVDGAAEKWASTMEKYATGVVPESESVSTAATALETALVTAFAAAAADPPTTLASMELAFTAFATTVGTGMAEGKPPWTAVPPPAPVGFATITTLFESSPENFSTPEKAAGVWSGLIDTWMKTGTATNPTGTTVNWS